MSWTLSPTANRPCGVSWVCRVWRLPQGSFHRRHRREGWRMPPPSRRGPQGACGDGYRNIHVWLRMSGVCTSQKRVRGIVAENCLQATHGRRRHPGRSYDGTIVTDRVDAVWGTDMTETMTGEGRVYLFVVFSRCSAEVLGFRIDRCPNRWAVMKPVR